MLLELGSTKQIQRWTPPTTYFGVADADSVARAAPWELTSIGIRRIRVVETCQKKSLRNGGLLYKVIAMNTQ